MRAKINLIVQILGENHKNMSRLYTDVNSYENLWKSVNTRWHREMAGQKQLSNVGNSPCNEVFIDERCGRVAVKTVKKDYSLISSVQLLVLWDL